MSPRTQASALPPISTTVASNINVATMKQLLLETATPLEQSSIFEQGAGQMSLTKAFQYLVGSATQPAFVPHLSAFPSRIDFLHCPYFWPYCTQPLYADSLPIVVNVTLLNSAAVTSYIQQPPQWISLDKGDLLSMSSLLCYSLSSVSSDFSFFFVVF